MIAPLPRSQSPRLDQSSSPEPPREDTAARSSERTRLEPDQPAPESVENEINRLTWSVLDGNATAAERRRLAELVAEQHNRRPPR